MNSSITIYSHKVTPLDLGNLNFNNLGPTNQPAMHKASRYNGCKKKKTIELNLCELTRYWKKQQAV